MRNRNLTVAMPLIHKVFRFVSRPFRAKRMALFESVFPVNAGIQVLDVGGDQNNWRFLHSTPEITVVNLARPRDWDDARPHFKFEPGNGMALKFKDASFDIVFSNSVIEHLGSLENQKLFAREVMRVGRSVFVQTPARSFIMEPHLLTPFIHKFPIRVQQQLIRNFSVWGILTRPTREEIDLFLSTTHLLSRREFADMFNDCEIVEERFLGMTKSLIAIRKQ